jgi:two-component system sensor histidine kinase KdpD
LGAHFIEVEDDDFVGAVARLAQERGSTYVFLGTPNSPRRLELMRGSLVSSLLRELPGVDIRIVADRALRRGADQ